MDLVVLEARSHSGDVGRSRATATAKDVDETWSRKSWILEAMTSRGLVILTELVWEAGVGVGTDEEWAFASYLGKVGHHVVRTERTVETEGEEVDMGDGIEESVERLTGEDTSALVGDRCGDHDGEVGDVAFLQLILNGIEGGLGIETIEDRLDEEDVDTTVEETARLLGIGFGELVEGYGAEARLLTSGDMEAVLFVGPMEPAAKRGRSGVE